MIESTTDISSLEGTSPRQTASTSADRVPNTVIADYGREREKKKVAWKLNTLKTNNIVCFHIFTVYKSQYQLHYTGCSLIRNRAVKNIKLKYGCIWKWEEVLCHKIILTQIFSKLFFHFKKRNHIEENELVKHKCVCLLKYLRRMFTNGWHLTFFSQKLCNIKQI